MCKQCLCCTDEYGKLSHRSLCCREQEIDMFGEICGISFTPDDSRLMTSIQEESFGGFLLHKRSPDIFYG